MIVKVLRGFCLGNGRDVYPGDTAEIDDHRAPLLIAQGKVRPLGETPAAAPRQAAPVADPTPAPVAEKPKRKGK